MKYPFRSFPIVLFALSLILGVIPISAAAGDDDGISMISISDLHFYCPNIPPSESIVFNQLIADAMNKIGELGKWPARDSSRLIYGYDAPIIDPSGVIVNGDLTNSFKKEQHQAFIDWRNSIQYPTYPGLGNHDIEVSGYYDSILFFGYFKPDLGDSLRCRKEAAWWMANLIEKEYIPNIVNRDLNGFVGLRSMLRVPMSRIGIGFWRFIGPDNKDSIFITDWSDPIPPRSGSVSYWGFMRIPDRPDRAERVFIQKTGLGQWVNVRSFSVPEPWQAQCYRVYSNLTGTKADTIWRPREWPNGDIGSLAYSFDIGPYYHFVQLQYDPNHTDNIPERVLAGPAVFNAGDAFLWALSPSLELTSSIEWLKEDLAAATEAGKYIVINAHTGVKADAIKEAIKDRNVVAIFHGHDHNIGPEDTISNTYNDSVYEIPVFDCGRTLILEQCSHYYIFNHLKFLLTSYHRTYFNVGVIEIEIASGQLKFDVDIKFPPPRFGRLDEGDTFSFSAGWSAHTYMIPEMFVANAGPDATASVEGENAAGNAFLYEWDFGDGNHSSGENPVHIYGDNGDYTVTVTIDDQQGRTGTETIQLAINNRPPAATVDSVLGPAGNLILPGQEASLYGSFSDPGYLDSHTAWWHFGDGTAAPGTVIEENESPDATGTITDTHIYGQPGMYTVILFVQDDDGAVDRATIDIRVMSPAEPDLVDQIDSVIQSLPPSCFKGPAEQHKIALSNKLAAVKKSMAAGGIEGAINKLTNDIRAKMDGYVDGYPKDDWIIDEEAQVELCELIDHLIDYLESGGAADAPRQPLVSNDDEEFGDNENLPAEFILLQNNPNPFNPVTRIPFAIPQASYVTLEVFNITGQKVATLVDGQLEAGEHAYWFDGSSVASGVYLYRLQAGDFVETRRMILLR